MLCEPFGKRKVQPSKFVIPRNSREMIHKDSSQDSFLRFLGSENPIPNHRVSVTYSSNFRSKFHPHREFSGTPVARRFLFLTGPAWISRSKRPRHELFRLNISEFNEFHQAHRSGESQGQPATKQKKWGGITARGQFNMKSLLVNDKRSISWNGTCWLLKLPQKGD